MTNDTPQTEAFPRTTLETLEELATLHRVDYEKAVKALDALSDDEKIARAYEKAEERVTKAMRLVQAIDAAVGRERGRLTTPGIGGIMSAAADIVNSGALDTDGMTVTATVSPAVDPITGEVDTPSVAQAMPTVFVHYPDADAYVETEVGQYTTYGELIADYLTAAGIDAETGAYMVLDSEDGDLCPPTAQIATEAYGRRYAVLPAPQPVESAA